MLLDGPGIPVSVLNSQSCLPKETCSDHGRWLRNCVWMDPAKSKHCHWNQVYVFRGSTEGVRVQTLNGLIDFLRPFFHGQNALFSHLHSLLCVLCVLRVLPCILYLRVLSRCHPATPPCSSAVREQPGQVWNGRRMRNLMASRQVSSLPTSRWECWGVSPELTVGFSFSVSTDVVPPLVPATAGCWEMFHCLGDSETSSIRPYTCTVHAPGYDVMEFGCLTNRSGNWPF